MRRRWKGVAAAVGVLVVLVVVATAALAASQVKGGSYKGSLMPSREGVVVSFRVSSNGRQVTGLETSNTPLYCSGGGKPTPVHFKSASISANGTFTSTGQYVIREGHNKGQVGTKLRITGRFLEGRAEQGTLTTTYVGFPACSGKSSYSTVA
jgi:hypothetical protein